MSNDKEKVRGAPFTLVSFIWRLLFAVVVVMATFNPTRYSYVQWLLSSREGHTLGPEHAVAGVALLGGWLIVVTATQRSLGSLGLIVLAAFLATLVWWLIDAGWLTTNSVSTIEWVTLTCLAVLLAVGMSWSFIWRRITGQYDVDDVDH
jgi:hypothetical protein